MVFDGAIVGGSWNVRRRYRKVLRGRWTVELSLDAGSVARLAAEHFLERGFEHYAFVEPPRFMPWANERREAYRSELAARGIACAVYRPPSGGDLPSRHRHLAAWLTAQSRPLAVLGAYDVEAILGERLARAKDLLRTTSLPCEEIASACGICDASSLAHLFRRKFGATPSSFRRDARS